MSSANPVNADVLKSADSGGFGRPAVRAWSEKSKLHLGADAGLSEDYERREEPENEESAFQIGINRCAEELGFVPTHICVASSPRRHCRRFTRSSGGVVVVLQKSAQASAPVDESGGHKESR